MKTEEYQIEARGPRTGGIWQPILMPFKTEHAAASFIVVNQEEDAKMTDERHDYRLVRVTTTREVIKGV